MAQEYIGLQARPQVLARRSKLETIADVMKAIAGGAQRPTHIMYKANLSWGVMQHYIKLLEAQGLVVIDAEEGKNLYHLSEKGFQLLSQFVSIRRDLNLDRDE